MNKHLKFHFDWGHWQDHQALLNLRRDAFFPDDYGRARRHSWNKTYRRWKPNSQFLTWVAQRFKL